MKKVILVLVLLITISGIVSALGSERVYAGDFVIVDGIELDEYIGPGGDVVVPEGIEIIGSCAFLDAKIQSITLPSTLKSIEYRAFEGTGITSIVIPEGVTNIERDAFQDCKYLEDITFPKSVSYIYYSAFDDTPWLEKMKESSDLLIINDILVQCNTQSIDTVIIPEGVRDIGGNAFSSSRAKSIELPSTLEHISDYAIYGREIVNTELPNVKYIGIKAFWSCTFSSLELPSLEYIGSEAFLKAGFNGSLTITSPLTIIEKGTFSGCNASSIILPDTITSIEEEAFMDTSITSIHLPDSLENISAGAFENSMLESVAIPEGVTIINGGAFRGSKALGTVIFKGATRLYNGTFYNCSSLINIVMETEIKTATASTFNGTAWMKERSDDEFVIINGVLLKYNGYSSEPVIPEAVRVIGGDAFSGNKTITKVNIPYGVTFIDTNAFDSCVILQEVIIADSVREIERNAFAECYNLSSIILPGALSELNAIFKNCYSLSELTIPASLRDNWFYFDGCDKLKDIYVYSGARYYPSITTDIRGITVHYLPSILSQSSQSFAVEGQPTVINAYVLTDALGGQTNFVQLRDLAAALNGTSLQFDISWTAEAGVKITTGVPYTAVGGESVVKDAGTKSGLQNVSSMMFNEHEWIMPAIEIEGNNYIELRYLEYLFDFTIEWDSETNCVNIIAR